MAITTLPCPACDARGRIAVNGSPFAALFVCDECAGTGEARCHVGRCNALAVDAVVIDNSATPMCAKCMAEYQADLEVEL